MRGVSRRVLFAGCLAGLALRSHGQGQEPRNTGWSVFLEQDSVLSPKTDKDYTMGMQFNFSGWRIRRSTILGEGLGGPLRGIDHLLFVDRAHDRACPSWSDPDWTDPDHPEANSVAPLCNSRSGQLGYQAHNFSFGVTAFTPRKGDPKEEGPGCEAYGCVLHDTEPVYNDRPYASLAYVTYRRSTALGKLAVSSDFTFGVLGLQIAKVVQTALHPAIADPGGWRHQISNRGEPTLNYAVRFKRLLLADYQHDALARDFAGADAADPSDDRIFDLTLDGGASLGLYTNGSAGARVRFGRIDSPYWTQDRMPVVFTKRGPDLKEMLRVREAYVWASAGYSYWLYNGLLQGQFRPATVKLSFHPAADDPNVQSPLNRGIWDWQVGVTLRFRPVAFSYQYTRYRNIFEGPHKREHAYWGIYVGFSNADLGM